MNQPNHPIYQEPVITPDLSVLWSEDQEAAMHCAQALFTPCVLPHYTPHPDIVEQTAHNFIASLIQINPEMPESSESIREAIVIAIRTLLHDLRRYPSEPFVEEYIDTALWSVFHLEAGELTESVCDILTDFCSGIWTLHLTKPQLYIIEKALARSLVAIPCEQMDIYWLRMQSGEEHQRKAMSFGLGYLSTAHAVPHLNYGLKFLKEHALRREILIRMEEIADPRCLPTLFKMRQEISQTDWTLTRLILRVIRVVEMVNRGGYQQTLLRPSTTKRNADEYLLHPANGNRSNMESDISTLLRPRGVFDKKDGSSD